MWSRLTSLLRLRCNPSLAAESEIGHAADSCRYFVLAGAALHACDGRGASINYAAVRPDDPAACNAIHQRGGDSADCENRVMYVLCKRAVCAEDRRQWLSTRPFGENCPEWGLEWDELELSCC